MTLHDEGLKLPEGFWERPLTARQLEDFAQCPHKFLLSQFVEREQVRRFLGGPAALHHALRSAIVQYYQQRFSSEDAEAVLLELFEDTWDGGLCSDSMEEDSLHRQGRRILTRFAADWLPGADHVLHADLQMTRRVGDGLFSAVADLVFGSGHDETPLQVLRLNSSRRPPSRRELSDDLSAGLLVLLSEEHFAPRSVGVGHYCLRPGRLHPVELTAEGRDELRDSLRTRVARMRREMDYEPRKGSHCRWCRARNRCRAWKR